jgi:hypothetical protein
MSQENHVIKLDVKLRFPITTPTYVNAIEVVPLELNLVQVDMGFLDVYNLPEDIKDNIKGGVLQPQSVSRIVMTSERAIELINELQKTLKLQQNVLLQTEGK